MIISNDMSDGRDTLEDMLNDIYPECNFIHVKKARYNVDFPPVCNNMLPDIISKSDKARLVPLTLRKRLLYMQMKAS